MRIAECGMARNGATQIGCRRLAPLARASREVMSDPRSPIAIPQSAIRIPQCERSEHGRFA
jgi:hypothetical protein